MSELQTKKQKLISLLKGLAIGGIGAALTYITETLPNIDLGEFTPIAVVLWSFVANSIRKIIT